jgi:hypothetical protein
MSVPWRGRETGNARYLSPAAVHVTRAPDCLDSPVYEPGQEHAIAQVLNAKERMDPARRMQIAYAAVVKFMRCWCRETGRQQWPKCGKSKKGVDFACP